MNLNRVQSTYTGWNQRLFVVKVTYNRAMALDNIYAYARTLVKTYDVNLF